jgi:glycosyltransferase involved in cell wall biosynthesis
MKILLVGNYRLSGETSMERFAALLEQGLRCAGHETKLLKPPVVAGMLSLPGTLGKWTGYADKFLVFPPLLKKAVQWADIVHICDQGNAFYVKHVYDRPLVLTCHDMVAMRSALGEIQYHGTSWTGRHLQRMILNGLRAAGRWGHIACVSEATRQDFLRIAGTPAPKVSRIYNGLNFPYSPQPTILARRQIERLGIGIGQRFIFHVSGNGWYKNRLGVLRMFKAFRSHAEGHAVCLVMAGKRFTREMRRFLFENGIGAHVIEVIHPSNEELRALYSAADLLLFPSLHEGFGWPIIEAQACGCPVVTSNRAPMTEVGGNAAIYVDPDNIESAASAIAMRIRDRKEPCVLSLRNAQRFSSSEMIRCYLEAYENLLDTSRFNVQQLRCRPEASETQSTV